MSNNRLQVLQRIAQRSAGSTPAVADELNALAEAGVSALMLAKIFATDGFDRAELSAIGFEEGVPDPTPIVINTHCIRTCVKQTIWIEIKGSCQRSVGR